MIRAASWSSELDKWLAAEGAGITYEEDIAPWLGEQAGFFVQAFSEEADGAAVIAATDPQAANEAIAKAAAADDGARAPPLV